MKKVVVLIIGIATYLCLPSADSMGQEADSGLLPPVDYLKASTELFNKAGSIILPQHMAGVASLECRTMSDLRLALEAKKHAAVIMDMLYHLVTDFKILADVKHAGNRKVVGKLVAEQVDDDATTIGEMIAALSASVVHVQNAKLQAAIQDLLPKMLQTQVLLRTYELQLKF